jgi:hypothetical protein
MGNMNEESKEIFTVRERIRRWKAYAGVFHLLTIAALVLTSLWVLPKWSAREWAPNGADLSERQESRQLLLEAMDKVVRYQKYYRELHGRYTRDLSRLSLPVSFAGGSMESLKRRYELSVLELHPNRFLVLATGINGTDRVTIDERHRLNANFVLPPPSRAYLLEEADRLLRLQAAEESPEDGVYVRYWRVNANEDQWFAVGQKNPILGERHELNAERKPATIFSSVREQIQSRIQPETEQRELAATSKTLYKETLDTNDVNEWLNSARLAQHVFRREKGRYAARWEDLDAVSDYRFSERLKLARNVRVQPIELQDSGFRLTIEGTSGDLMGEQFVIDQSGALRQVRYTEALIQQLQETTDILESTFRFQIKALDDPARRAQP